MPSVEEIDNDWGEETDTAISNALESARQKPENLLLAPSPFLETRVSHADE